MSIVHIKNHLKFADSSQRLPRLVPTPKSTGETRAAPKLKRPRQGKFQAWPQCLSVVTAVPRYPLFMTVVSPDTGRACQPLGWLLRLRDGARPFKAFSCYWRLWSVIIALASKHQLVPSSVHFNATRHVQPAQPAPIPPFDRRRLRCPRQGTGQCVPCVNIISHNFAA